MARLQGVLVQGEACAMREGMTNTWVRDNFALASPPVVDQAWWQTWPGVALLVAGSIMVGILGARAATK